MENEIESNQVSEEETSKGMQEPYVNENENGNENENHHHQMSEEETNGAYLFT